MEEFREIAGEPDFDGARSPSRLGRMAVNAKTGKRRVLRGRKLATMAEFDFLGTFVRVTVRAVVRGEGS